MSMKAESVDHFDDELAAPPKKPFCGHIVRKGCRDNLFTLLTLLGVCIGFGIGVGVAQVHPSDVVVQWISMFFRCLVDYSELPHHCSETILSPGS